MNTNQPSIREDVRHLALQPPRDLLQRLQRDVLLTHFQPMQRCVTDTQLLRELGVGEFPALFAQKVAELFWEPLSHECSVCRGLLLMCKICF